MQLFGWLNRNFHRKAAVEALCFRVPRMAPLHGKLKIRRLEIVLTIDSQGTLSKAAELLGVTQFGLSRAIAEIEEMAGGRLRIGNSTAPQQV